MGSKIYEKDITFVIQGAIIENNGVNPTQKLIDSINLFYPDSKIIVSTWFGMLNLVKGYQRGIESEDPGGLSDGKTYLNVNRQIISSLRGIELCESKYCVKIRSDMILINNNLLKIKDCYEKISEGSKFEPITISNLTSVNHIKCNRLFSLCDWFYFARTTDLKLIFDIPLYPDEYFYHFSPPYEFQGNITSQRFNAEQWITINYLKKIGYCLNDFDNGFSFNDNLIKINDRAVSSLFFIRNMESLGFRSQKYKVYNFSMKYMYTEKEWLNLFMQSNGVSFTVFKKIYFFLDFERYFYNVISNKTLRIILKRIISFCKN